MRFHNSREGIIEVNIEVRISSYVVYKKKGVDLFDLLVGYYSMYFGNKGYNRNKVRFVG